LFHEIVKLNIIAVNYNSVVLCEGKLTSSPPPRQRSMLIYKLIKIGRMMQM